MIAPDVAQRKLIAGFLEKFSVALATAISAKVFFAEENLTLMTYCAIGLMTISIAIGLFLIHGTEKKPKDKPDVMHTEVKKGVFHINNAEISQ